jgi:hypothetical protein
MAPPKKSPSNTRTAAKAKRGIVAPVSHVDAGVFLCDGRIVTIEK